MVVKTRHTVDHLELIGRHEFPSTTKLVTLILSVTAFGFLALVAFVPISKIVDPIAAGAVVVAFFSVCLVWNVERVSGVVVVTEDSISRKSPLWFMGWTIPSIDVRVIEVEHSRPSPS
jgi:hypothetical protein